MQRQSRVQWPLRPESWLVLMGPPRHWLGRPSRGAQRPRRRRRCAVPQLCLLYSCITAFWTAATQAHGPQDSPTIVEVATQLGSPLPEGLNTLGGRADVCVSGTSDPFNKFTRCPRVIHSPLTHIWSPRKPIQCVLAAQHAPFDPECMSLHEGMGCPQLCPAAVLLVCIDISYC